MLQTQVAYWTMQESKRHNLVSEDQNKIDLMRKEKELNNTINYNKKQVDYWNNQLKELTRHNKVTEKLSAKELKTKQQQAKASLQQAKAALKNAETQRLDLANRAKQAEASMISAEASRTSAEAAKQQADTSRYLSRSQAQKNRAETGLIRKQRQLTGKKVKYYKYTDLALPGANAAANLIRSVGTII